MESSARTSQRIACASLVIAAFAACTNRGSNEPQGGNEPNAPTGGATASAPSSSPQEGGKSLAQQKQELVVRTALENAKAFREQGKLVEARDALAQAREADPSNVEVSAQYFEVLELLGERPGDIQTATAMATQQAAVRRKSLQMQAEEYERLGEEARSHREHDAAIRWFEQVQASIRWSTLDVDWGDLPHRNEQALATARRERDEAQKAQRETQLQEAVKQIRADEAAERARQNERVVTLLESANFKFEQGDYDGAIDLCKQVLALEPSNTVAPQLLRSSMDGRRQQKSAEFEKARGDAYRRFKNDIDELRIPYSEGLTPPDSAYWARVSARRPTGAGDLDSSVSDDQRLRESLKSIRIPLVNFEDSDLKFVCSFLSNYSGVTVIVAPEVQGEIESSGTLITLTNLTNLSIDSILTIVTNRLGEKKYSWTVKNGVVQITTLENAFGKTVIRTHAIQDLTFGRTDFKGPAIDKIALPGEYGDDPETSVFAQDLEKVVQITPDDVVTLIKENVARETWELGDKKFTIQAAANNQILVIHTPEVQDQIEAFLNDLRRFTTTVVQIESRFIEITDAFVQEIGVDFRGLGGAVGPSVNLDDVTTAGEDIASRGLDNLGTGTTGTSAPSVGIFFNDKNNSRGDFRGRSENYFENNLGSILSTKGGGAMQFAIFNDASISAVVNLVQKSANATEVMAPELTVFNTERAYVSVLNEVSFLQDFDVDVANTAFIANPNIGVLQEGAVLDVRPTISYDRKYVTLDVRTTVATITRPIQNFQTTLGGFSTAVTFQLPRLQVQNAGTTVIVPDGGGVILGGLKTLNYVNRRAEVPLLARIPIVGVLFRQKGYADEAKSLVILVKANIRDLTPYREAMPVR